MSAVGKPIERLIVRFLDGELSAEEELELNREILRNPEAHRLLEEYRRIDELAATVLDQAIPQQAGAVRLETQSLPAAARRARLSHRAWWLLPGAMAAALVIVVVSGPEGTPQPEQPSVDSSWKSERNVMPALRPVANSQSQMHRVSDMPARRRVTRDIHRDIFGVIGEDGNLYFIEVDRTRTIKRPHERSTARRPAEEL